MLKEHEITFVITEAGGTGTNTTASATVTATTMARETTVIEPKCIAASVGLAIPLIALIPIGLSTQMAIPGLNPVVEQVSLQIERANANIRQQIGIFNPGTAVQAAEINARLRSFSLDLATVGAGLALLAAGILSGTILYEACVPEDSKPMSSDMKLKGSSGKTHQARETTGKLTTCKAAPSTTTTK